MRFERLVMEAGDSGLALDLHPRLTIIAGVNELEREALISEFVGALGSARDGLHLELMADSGEHYSISRPSGEDHRVVSIETASDVTSEFLSEDGKVDLLAKAGLNNQEAVEAMRFGTADLNTANESDLTIRRLSQLDQNELWAAAEAMSSAKRRLDQESDEASGITEDNDLIEEIETQHARLETQTGNYLARRKFAMIASAGAAVLSIPTVILLSPWAVLPLVAIAILLTLSAFVARRASNSARKREEAALEQSGAQSYLGFHLQRVNGLLSSDQARKRMVNASDEHKEALRRWNVIAGSIDVTWVMENRETITTAVRVRSDVSSGSNPGSESEATTASDFAHTLVNKLAQLRGLGTGRENFPALLDDPFIDLDDTMLAALLGLMLRSSNHQQIILMTADRRISDWARIESMTGELSLIEPKAALGPSSVSEVKLDAKRGQ